MTQQIQADQFNWLLMLGWQKIGDREKFKRSGKKRSEGKITKYGKKLKQKKVTFPVDISVHLVHL